MDAETYHQLSCASDTITTYTEVINHRFPVDPWTGYLTNTSYVHVHSVCPSDLHDGDILVNVWATGGNMSCFSGAGVVQPCDTFCANAIYPIVAVPTVAPMERQSMCGEADSCSQVEGRSQFLGPRCRPQDPSGYIVMSGSFQATCCKPKRVGLHV